MNYKNQISLYPNEARVINLDNTEFLSANTASVYVYEDEVMYIKFLKTNIPSGAVVDSGKLYLHISSVGGTTSANYNLCVDIYAATGAVDSSTTLSQVRALKSNNKIGKYCFVSNSITDEAIEIDIKEYLSDYVYGNTIDYGLIIEVRIDDSPGYSQYAGVSDSDNDRFILFGGELNNNRNSNSIYIYDVVNNVFNEVNTLEQVLPEKRIDTYHAIYNDNIYIYGGYEHSSTSPTYYNDLWEFNLESNTWREITPEASCAYGSPSYLRGGRMVINQDGIMYLVFGINNSDVANADIWKLDLTANILAWDKPAQLGLTEYKKESSYDFSMVYDSRVGHEYDYYIIGGAPLSTRGRELHKVRLNLAPNWSHTVTKSALELPARSCSDAIFYDGFIYYFVGEGSDGNHNDLYKIHPDTFSVTLIEFEGSKPEARDNYRTFLYGSKLYVVNGYVTSKGENRSADVWYTDLSITSDRRWVESYNQSSTYTNNANTIRIVGMSSYDSLRGERQGPFISLEYNYDTTYNIESSKISQVITRDTYLSKDAPLTNFGNENYVISIAPNEISGVEKKAIFYLDLSSLSDGDDVLFAMLYVPRSSSSNIMGNQHFMELIKEDWGELQANWQNRKTNELWSTQGGYFEDDYSSYNMVIGSNMVQYDITRMIQKIQGSFSEATNNYYGVAIYNQDMIFDSKQLNNTSYLVIKYIDNTNTKEVGEVTLVSPNNAEDMTSSPTYVFKVPYNASGGRLHFRLELSQDIAFSDDEITSFSTQTSQTGWYWDSDGSDSGYISFPNNGILGYTGDTSLVKFIMSETTSTLSTGTWFWRVIAICL